MAQENKKTEIIESAITIFSSEGFDHPTMEYIANKASVSKRTLYKHFSSKNDLLQEIIPYLINKTNDSIATVQLKGKTPRDQLVEIIRCKLETIFEPDNLKLARILIGEMLKEQNSISSTLDNVFKNESFIHDWIINHQEKGIIRKDKEVFDLILRLNDLIHGLVLFPLILRERTPCPNDSLLIADLYMLYLSEK